MTDQEIVKGLIERDADVTRDFFFVKCKPLFCSIMNIVFEYEVEYDEMIGEWEEEMMGFKAEQETELLFRDAQGDNLPPCSQDFFDYWHNGPHIEDFSWLTFM